MAEDVSRVLKGRGVRNLAMHERAGDVYWTGVSQATGGAVLVRWRTQQAEKELAVHTKLNQDACAAVPRVVGSVPFGTGKLLIYERPRGSDLSEILDAHRGVVSIHTLARVCVGVAKAVATLHAARVFLGAVSPRYVRTFL